MSGIRRDAADKWFSDCIRHRAQYRCECCGRSFEGLVQGYENAHIFGRANKSTRWCADNAVALCSACHRRFTEHPLEFHDFLMRHLGAGHLDMLREKKNQIFKTTAAIRKEIAKHYRDEFRRMTTELDHSLISYN